MPAMPVLDVSTDQDQLAALHRQVAHLREAVVSHERIGFATGLLAQRFGCNPEQAWQLMVRLSQTTNVKLRTIAAVLTDTHSRRIDDEDLHLAATLEALLSRPSTSARSSETAVHHVGGDA